MILQKETLTKKQKTALELIRIKIQQTGYPPTVRELCKALGVHSSATAFKYLKILEKKGYIKREKEKTRAIKLMPQTRNLPLVGKVAAGNPLLALQEYTEVIPVPEELAGTEGSFLVRVEGDSMLGDHILDGDYVIVQPQNYADNGDIVIALLNQEEVTVKRLYQNRDKITLKPSNPAYQPIITRDIKILGKVIGIIRKYNGRK
ncbi:MAG: transcriptional repressor LexA [Atribacterota bacterium]|nr:transcriptional repressor LexA [Atribacterota bacterium]MDD4895683.1 transcriptional repressor LexA [Atribacterota bacterium]MDD5637142.1 transcriptional repressor LexA [Atribacterota bacterium]